MLLLPKGRLGNVRSRPISVNSRNELVGSNGLDPVRSIADLVAAISGSSNLSPSDLKSVIRASMFHANNLNADNTTKVIRFCASKSMSTLFTSYITT